MNIKRMVTGLLAALALSWTTAVYADNSTEFGIADDLTVLGTLGAGADPDLEIKGFSVFGSTQATYPGPITTGAGNVVVNGVLAVSSGMYVSGSSTFTQRVEIQGYGVFQSTVNMVEGNLKYGTAVSGKVLKSGGSGYVYWGDDSIGGFTAGIQNRLPMYNNSGLTESQFLQNASNLGITLISGSSMTINGPMESTGTVKLGNSTAGIGDVTIVGAATAQNGVSVTGGNVSVTNNLTVNNDTQLGNDPTIDVHSINGPTEPGVALKVVGADDNTKYTAKFYSGTSLAAWIKKK